MIRGKKWNSDDPDFRKMVEQVKWEIALEMGVTIPRDGSFGHLRSKDLGMIGAQLRKRVSVLMEWQAKQMADAVPDRGKENKRKGRSGKRSSGR